MASGGWSIRRLVLSGLSMTPTSACLILSRSRRAKSPNVHAVKPIGAMKMRGKWMKCSVCYKATWYCAKHGCVPGKAAKDAQNAWERQQERDYLRGSDRDEWKHEVAEQQ